MRLKLNDKRERKIGFAHAWNGLWTVFKRERNFRIHLIASIIVVGCGLIVKLTVLEWLFICLTITLVFVTETINSVIEMTVDFISTENHPSAKIIKDMAAGAVLITAVASIVVGLIIFLPKIKVFLL